MLKSDWIFSEAAISFSEGPRLRVDFIFEMCLYYTEGQDSFAGSQAERLEGTPAPPMVTRSLQQESEKRFKEYFASSRDWEQSKQVLQDMKNRPATDFPDKDKEGWIAQMRDQTWSDGARARWYQERFEALYIRPNK